MIHIQKLRTVRLRSNVYHKSKLICLFNVKKKVITRLKMLSYAELRGLTKQHKKCWRKENKTSLSSHYNVVSGGEYRHTRHKKSEDVENLPFKTSMVSGKFQKDYTPFFKFVISKVGTNFDTACSEAKPRMDEKFFEVLGWIFDDFNHTMNGENSSMFRCGESTEYSRLIVDKNGLIQFRNVNYHNELKRKNKTLVNPTK